MTGPIDFFTNGDAKAKEGSVVQAQAFSLTKVMAVLAPLVTGVAAWATSRLEDVTFTSAQVTTLIVALIAFLALTASADVIARGVAAASQVQADARAHIVEFSPPLTGKADVDGAQHRTDVRIVGASNAADPEFLCVYTEDDKPRAAWVKATSVHVG